MNNRSNRANLAFRGFLLRSLQLEGRTAMASTSSPAPAVAPVDQMATDAFLSSLAELRSMPHTHVSEKPVGRAEKPNDFGVLVTLNIPEKKRKQKRFAVTGPKGDRPNLIGRLVLERRQEQEGLPSSRL